MVSRSPFRRFLRSSRRPQTPRLLRPPRRDFKNATSHKTSSTSLILYPTIPDAHCINHLRINTRCLPNTSKTQTYNLSPNNRPAPTTKKPFNSSTSAAPDASPATPLETSSAHAAKTQRSPRLRISKRALALPNVCCSPISQKKKKTKSAPGCGSNDQHYANKVSQLTLTPSRASSIVPVASAISMTLRTTVVAFKCLIRI